MAPGYSRGLFYTHTFVNPELTSGMHKKTGRTIRYALFNLKSNLTYEKPYDTLISLVADLDSSFLPIVMFKIPLV